MTVASSQGKWRGIFPPLVTPLKDRDSLDEEGLERLVEHVLEGGVHGLFILGTTGEAPGLSYRLRRELIQRTCALVRGRVPVLVGITDTAVVELLSTAKAAADAGAAAVVLSAPYYFPAGQPELVEYLQHVARELPLPAFLYNMPTHTKITFEQETVCRAMELPNIIGMKDSSANMIYFQQLLEQLAHRPGWSLFMGSEELLAESLLLGGDGGVCGGANLWPRLYVDLFNAAIHQDLPEVLRLHQQVAHLAGTIYHVGRHRSSVIKGLKCALACLGICGDFMAEPFHRFRDPERAQIARYVAELGIVPHHKPD